MSAFLRSLISLVETAEGGEAAPPLPPGVYLSVSRSETQPDDDDDEEEEFEPEEDGTFVMAFTTAEKDMEGGDLCIAHLHVPDDNIGHTGWYAGDVSVSPAWQRKGVATALYHAMSEELGLPPRPSQIQSPAAQKMWASGKLGNG